MPDPLEEDGELEGALGELTEEEAAEDEGDDPEEPVDRDVADAWPLWPG